MLDLADVKEYLEITDVDAVRDARLESLMLRAIEAVERELDWYFGQPRAAEEILNGSGFSAMWLRQPPVNGLTAYSRTGPTHDWDEVDSDDYEQDGRGVWHANGIWFSGVRNWRFVYDEGFTVPPGDVVQFTLDLIKAKWNEPAIQGIVSETLGRYSYTLGDLESTTGWPSVVANWKRGRI